MPWTLCSALGPELFGSRTGQVRLDILLPPPTLSTFVEQIRDVTRSATARSPREISRRSEDSRDKADFCLRYFCFVCLTDPSRPDQKYTAVLDDGMLSSYGNFNEKSLTFHWIKVGDFLTVKRPCTLSPKQGTSNIFPFLF